MDPINSKRGSCSNPSPVLKNNELLFLIEHLTSLGHTLEGQNYQLTVTKPAKQSDNRTYKEVVCDVKNYYTLIFKKREGGEDIIYVSRNGKKIGDSRYLAEAYQQSLQEKKVIAELKAENQQQIDRETMLFLVERLRARSSNGPFQKGNMRYFASVAASSILIKWGRERALRLMPNSEGKISAIFEHGVCSREMSGNSVKTVHFIAKELSKVHNSYLFAGGMLEITLLKRCLMQNPRTHLYLLGNALEAHEPDDTSLLCKIFFLDDNLQQVGNDSGGIFRSYISDLFKGLEAKVTSSYLPPDYRMIGRIIMHCYRSNTRGKVDYTIGHFFSETFYKALYFFTHKEITSDYSELGIKRKLALIALIAVSESSNIDELVVRALQNEGKALLPSQLTQLLHYSGEKKVPQETPQQSLIRIRERVQAKLFHKYEKRCIAYHAAAGGAFDLCRGKGISNSISWQSFTANVKPKHFMERVQGSLSVVDTIVLLSDLPEIAKKVQWLKQWLQDPSAPDKRVASFLTYVTGGTTLPKECSILIDRQSGKPSPLPKAKTCTYQLFLSPDPCGEAGGYNDWTKEAFIHALEHAILLGDDNFFDDQER